MTTWILLSLLASLILFIWISNNVKSTASQEVSVDDYSACNGRTIEAIVAGTGFEGRAELIRDNVEKGMTVILHRDPDNEHDENAIEVLIPYGSHGRLEQIGFLKKKRANSLSKIMDSGVTVKAKVNSFYALDKTKHPRISLTICIEDS